MTTTAARPSAAVPASTGIGGPVGRVLVAAAAAGSAVAVAFGLRSGPLWLDEAQSVSIARLPLASLTEALREDGAPPLYYLLLHAWTAVVGVSEVAVRLLSALLLLVAAGLVHALGDRLLGRAGGRAAVLALLTLPWTLRYAAEARMYLLLVVLVLTGALCALTLHQRASWAAGAGLAAATSAVLHTHYWSLLVLAVSGAGLLPGLWRREAPAARTTLALAVGGLTFLPWLPVFFYQTENTAAPWARPPGVPELLRTPEAWSAGPLVPRVVYALALVALAVQALRAARRTGSPVAPRLAVLLVLPLLVAWAAAALGGGAYVGRYTAVVVPFLVLLLGAGLLALPPSRQVPTGVALGVAGLVLGGVGTAQLRTQAGEVAAAVAATGEPGDVVLVCPDQLGPALARELDPAFALLAYPTLGPADRVDWTGYAQRQDDAAPDAVAARVHALAGDAQVFVDFAPAYRTFGQDCQQVVQVLAELRGEPSVELPRRLSVDEEHRLYRFGAP